MNIRRMATGLTLALLGLMTPGLTQAQTEGQTPPSAASKVTNDNRLFIRFIEDAAIVPSYRAEGQFWVFANEPSMQESFGLDDVPNNASSSRHHDADKSSGADVFELRPLFAMNVAEDLEFGARLGIAQREPDNGSGDTGLTDLDLWGKISLVSDPVKISAGLVLSLPTGDGDTLLGTGETNVEFFGAIRKDFSKLTVAGNVGVRINQDQDLNSNHAEGKNSLLVGAAVLIPAGAKTVLSAEWAIETERLEGLNNYSTLLAGAEYRYSEDLSFRAAIGGGLSEGSPDFLLTCGIVWHF